MVKHIVCFKLKEGESKEKAKEVLLSMKEHTPWLRDIKVHIDELQTARSFDVILETLFESFMDLEEYQVDRYHVDVVKKHMHAVTEKSISLDYQIEKEEF